MSGKTVEKKAKTGYTVKGKQANQALIKAKKTDIGGTFLVYDLTDDTGKCLALNRYVYEDNTTERPFAALSIAEEDILNPPIVEEEPTGA